MNRRLLETISVGLAFSLLALPASRHLAHPVVAPIYLATAVVMTPWIWWRLLSAGPNPGFQHGALAGAFCGAASPALSSLLLAVMILTGATRAGKPDSGGWGDFFSGMVLFLQVGLVPISAAAGSLIGVLATAVRRAAIRMRGA